MYGICYCFGRVSFPERSLGMSQRARQVPFLCTIQSSIVLTPDPNQPQCPALPACDTESDLRRDWFGSGASCSPAISVSTNSVPGP